MNPAAIVFLAVALGACNVALRRLYRNPMKRAIALVLFLAGVACVAADEAPNPSAAAWVGTITTEGSVTTVVNESGSVWGGTSTLVEELSIGVDAGEEPYMFGTIGGLAATDDRIFVLDRSIPTVRVFDEQGKHLQDIGREGAGPGELESPSDIKIDDDADRLYVRDYILNRITVFDLAGGLIDTWPLDGTFSTIQPMVSGVGGRLYTKKVVERGDGSGERRMGMVPYAPDGSLGEAIVEPSLPVDAPALPPVVGTGFRFEGPVPFSPRYVWTMSPTLAQVAGTSDRYSFELRGPSATTIVERWVEPVPLASDEAAWHKRARIAINRSFQEDWAWGSAPMPAHKPFFEELYADLDGRIWVRRLGPGVHAGECDEDPDPGPAPGIRYCWQDTVIFDVFEAAGRFLGQVELPQTLRFSSKPLITGDTIILVQEDDAGTIMVKRYRMVRPATS